MRTFLIASLLVLLPRPSWSLSVSGPLEALETVPIRPKISGYVVRVDVSPQSRVAEGQVLAVLDSRDLEAQAALGEAASRGAEAAETETGADSDEARRQAERMRELASKGLAPAQEVSQAEDADFRSLVGHDEAEGKRARAQVQLESVRGSIRRARIVSPVEGWVTACSLDVGSMVAPGLDQEPFFVIATDLSQLRLAATLTKEQASSVKAGDPVSFAAATYPGMAFPGKVSEVQELPHAAGAKAFYRADLRVENPKQMLWPGEKVEAVLGGGVAAGAARRPEELSPQGVDWKAFTDDDVAVVVGIESYPELPASDFSRSDAELVKRFLLALGMREGNIQTLLDEKASFASIRKVIETWLPNKVRKGARVFVYYSGHGAPEPATGDAYWVPADGDPNYLKDTAYPLKRLYEKLGALPAKEVLVVLDSCFSGAGGRSLLAKGARPLVMRVSGLALPANMAVLTATRGTQISTSSEDKRHGVFTYHFLSALRQGKASLSEVYEAVAPAVEDEARSLNVEQVPEMVPPAGEAKGRFLLKQEH